MKLKLIATTCLLLSPSILFAVTLQDAVGVAVQTNPDILAAGSVRNAVSKEVRQAKAGYFPTLDFAIGTGWEVTDNPTTRRQGQVKFIKIVMK